jgi:HAD superfamily hydrolase (TIGR01509 family)
MRFGLLFDIDGTLMDTFDAILASMNEALDAFGVKALTSAELRPLIGMPVARQMDLLRGMEGPTVDQITDLYYVHFMERVERGLPLYPGVADTLSQLADHPISTMTTRRLQGARRMLEVSGIASYFKAIVGGDEVSRPKPYPDLPLFSARALGIPPEQCVVIGDAPVDILAGRAARMATVAVTYGYGSATALREAKPHAMIGRFAELPNVVDELESRALSP